MLNKNNESMKRILFCFHYSDLNNGAVRSMVDVIETLIKVYNVEAYIIYPDHRGSAIDYLEQIGAQCYRIPFYRVDFYKTLQRKQIIKNDFIYLLKKMIAPYCFYKASRIISNHNIEAIYSNTIVIDYGFYLGKKTERPHFWHIREFGKEDHGLSLRCGEKKLYKHMSDSKAIIYISKAIEEKYRSKLNNNTAQYVIHNDISTEFINPKKSFNMDIKSPLHVAIIGTIQKGKGQLEAIQAAELVNKIRKKIILHIAGKTTGEYFDEIKKYVIAHDLSQFVLFDGFIKDVNKYRTNMDVGIVASSYEAFGRVTIEGMLSKLTIIGADVAGTLELINDKKNGLLYHKGDIEQLANNLDMLYNNRIYMKQLAEEGYLEAVEKYTTHRAAKKIADIFI